MFVEQGHAEVQGLISLTEETLNSYVISDHIIVRAELFKYRKETRKTSLVSTV